MHNDKQKPNAFQNNLSSIKTKRVTKTTHDIREDKTCCNRLIGILPSTK